MQVDTTNLERALEAGAPLREMAEQYPDWPEARRVLAFLDERETVVRDLIKKLRETTIVVAT
jgi:hypothetical protein